MKLNLITIFFTKFKYNLTSIKINKPRSEFIFASLKDLENKYLAKVTLEIIKIEKHHDNIFINLNWDWKNNLKELESFFENDDYYKALDLLRIFKEKIFLNLYGIEDSKIKNFNPFEKITNINTNNENLKEFLNNTSSCLIKINDMRNKLKEGSSNMNFKNDFNKLSNIEKK